ncbi:MAG TPA: hypothetical protein PKH19_05235, partial [Candidatus Syntrophosphaera sp.]|nr:hypothetical protein [Candidatus Syntrophosphaera sp.]
PTWSFLPRLALDAQLGVPGDNRFRSALAGEFQTRFSPAFLVNHQALFHAASADSFSAQLLSYTLSNRARSLKLGDLMFSELTTRLSVDDLNQALGGTDLHDRDLGLEHQHRLQWDRHGVLNGLWLQGAALGLTLRYQIPDRGGHWPELSFGLMSDFQRLLPAIGLHSRIIHRPDLILELGNRPEIKAWSLSEQRQLYPWSAADLKDRLTLAPLNLTLQAYAMGGRDAIFQLTRLQHRSRFLYNHPTIAALPSGQTELRFSELMHNQTRFELRLRLWHLSLEQSVALNLEHEPDSAWRRRPYSPLFTAETGLSAELGKVDLSLSLLQQYRQQDELGRRLPDLHDLSLGLEYPVYPELRVSAGLDNLLDSRYSLPGDLPRPRRGFRISFQYLPLR